MANEPNIKQKLYVIPINAQTEQTLQNYLNLGYVIHQIVNLSPVVNSLLIVYTDPTILNEGGN